MCTWHSFLLHLLAPLNQTMDSCLPLLFKPFAECAVFAILLNNALVMCFILFYFTTDWVYSSLVCQSKWTLHQCESSSFTWSRSQHCRQCKIQYYTPASNTSTHVTRGLSIVVLSHYKCINLLCIIEREVWMEDMERAGCV